MLPEEDRYMTRSELLDSHAAAGRVAEQVVFNEVRTAPRTTWNVPSIVRQMIAEYG